MATAIGSRKPKTVASQWGRLRHGGRADYRLVIGELPSPLLRQQRAARRYRCDLEDAVAAQHGHVSIPAAHLIDAAAGAELHASICRWLLRERLATMTTADIVTCSREIVRAREARNRAVAGLRLEATPQPSFELYGPSDEPDPLADPKDQPTDPTASDGQQEAQGANQP